MHLVSEKSDATIMVSQNKISKVLWDNHDKTLGEWKNLQGTAKSCNRRVQLVR